MTPGLRVATRSALRTAQPVGHLHSHAVDDGRPPVDALCSAGGTGAARASSSNWTTRRRSTAPSPLAKTSVPGHTGLTALRERIRPPRGPGFPDTQESTPCDSASDCEGSLAHRRTNDSGPVYCLSSPVSPTRRSALQGIYLNRQLLQQERGALSGLRCVVAHGLTDGVLDVRRRDADPEAADTGADLGDEAGVRATHARNRRPCR